MSEDGNYLDILIIHVQKLQVTENFRITNKIQHYSSQLKHIKIRIKKMQYVNEFFQSFRLNVASLIISLKERPP